MVVVLAGGAQDALARHGVAVVREVVLALTGVALAALVYVAVRAVGRTLYNHIQHDTFNPSSLIDASVKHFYRTQLSYFTSIFVSKNLVSKCRFFS